MKARQAKKLLKKMSVLHLEPNDVLMFTFPDNTPQQTLMGLRPKLEAIFPGRRLLLLPRAIKVSAVREDS